MAYHIFHSYRQAYTMAQRKPALISFYEYHNKPTPQMIGDADYRLDYVEERHPDDDEIKILVGDKINAVVVTIQDATPELAEMEQFKKYTVDDLDYYSQSNQNTIKFVNTVIHHLKTVFKIKRVEILDNAILYKYDGYNIRGLMPISRIYILKYNTNYYTKNWGFHITFIKDVYIKLPTHYYKTQVIEYYSPEYTENMATAECKTFVNKLYDKELITDFVNRYKINESEINIFFTFINENVRYSMSENTYYLDL